MQLNALNAKIKLTYLNIKNIKFSLFFFSYFKIFVLLFNLCRRFLKKRFYWYMYNLTNYYTKTFIPYINGIYILMCIHIFLYSERKMWTFFIPKIIYIFLLREKISRKIVKSALTEGMHHRDCLGKDKKFIMYNLHLCLLFFCIYKIQFGFSLCKKNPYVWNRYAHEYWSRLTL